MKGNIRWPFRWDLSALFKLGRAPDLTRNRLNDAPSHVLFIRLLHELQRAKDKCCGFLLKRRRNHSKIIMVAILNELSALNYLASFKTTYPQNLTKVWQNAENTHIHADLWRLRSWNRFTSHQDTSSFLKYWRYTSLPVHTCSPDDTYTKYLYKQQWPLRGLCYICTVTCL